MQTFDVQGLRELEQQLTALGAETGVATLRRAGRKAMEPVKEAAIAGAGEDSGDTKKAITISTSRKRNAKSRAINIRVGATKRIVVDIDSEGNKTKRRVEHVAHAVIAQEFGTSKQDADPFLRPALEDNAELVLSTFKTELGKAITRAMRKQQSGNGS